MGKEISTWVRSLELFRIVVWAQGKAGEGWIRERALSFQQASTLGYLIKNPGAMQRDIVQMSRTSAASVSSLLKGLERRGFVERRTEGGDERSKRVYATSAGIKLIAGLDIAMAAVDKDILSPLNKAEQTALLALLTKITAKLPQSE
jgi:MarR family transcriptional regulator, repressor for mepA